MRHPSSFFVPLEMPCNGISVRPSNKFCAKGQGGGRQPQDKKCKEKARTVPEGSGPGPHNEFDKGTDYLRKVLTVGLRSSVRPFPPYSDKIVLNRPVAICLFRKSVN